MPGGSDPTVGIHNLAYPICYMPTYINKSSKSMGTWPRHFRVYPLLKLHQQGAMSTRLAAGLKALSRLTILGGGRLSESADATDA